MPLDSRRTIRTTLAVLLFVAGCLLSLATEQQLALRDPPRHSATLFDAPGFVIRTGRKTLQVTGTTVSDQHERALLQLIGDHFDGFAVRTAFRPGLALPPYWDAATIRLLYLVATTESTNASLQPGHLQIDAVAVGASGFEDRLRFLRESLPANATVDADVRVVAADGTLQQSCERNFHAAANDAVYFRQSSATIRTSSYPILDRLAEYAYECRDSRIAIRGHSDASGSESWNRQISLARAQAVADYLVDRGIPAEQLVVEGFGSSYPVTDNDSAQGRERNRRVELGLR